MKITEEKGKIILEDLHDFNPVHTFMCGQCFRWDEADGGFIGIAHGRAVLQRKYTSNCRKMRKRANKTYNLQENVL